MPKQTSMVKRVSHCIGWGGVGALFAALLTIAVVHAQVTSSPTAPVGGRAPVVSIEVVNATSPGEQVAPGHQLRANATATDPDGDTITGTTYRWLRGTTQVGTGATYTTVAADSGQALTVEATATTNPVTTNPASGKGTKTVSVAATTSLVSTANTAAQVLTVGQTAYTFSPLTAVSGGKTPYTYEVQSGTLPTGLVLDAATGAVTGTPTTIRAAANVVFRVKDANNLAAPTTSTVSYTVNAALTATAVTTAQVLTVGEVAATFSPLTSVTGGKTPYTYEIQSGTLPTGLTLNAATGAVTGTPTTAQAAANVVFRVKDANNVAATTTSTVSYAVNAALTATANTAAQVLTVGQASASFSPLTSVGGGVAPYSYEIVSGTLPAGLVLDAATGAVTGTPTTVQAAENVVFRVKDANNVAATNTSTVSYLVGLPTVTISPFDADPIYVGQAINLTGSYTFIANGGPPEQGSTYQWYLGKASDGSDKVAIDGATQRTLSYTIQPMDQNRHLFFEVTPRNAVFTGQKVTTATQRIVFGSTTVAGNGTITITVTGITPTAVPHFTFMGVAPCRVRVKLPGASTTFGNANVWRTAGPQINPNIWFTLEPEGCAATEFRLYFATP